ncbi:hypothetical protein OICFNHDK_0180 [Methylobacterium bullatum]|uniref:Uncharacterized protein n=1 Tax=Methylobacterium bullatum TaxID=570505 RepID=A0AAV4Z2A7_9HYPH|nr:hypothetical protein OICFNHDK_0180 [Methylobacterium bullatum]
MRVLVENANGAVLDVGIEDNVLLPLDTDERAAAFEALSGALALLAGITPRDARGAEPGQYSTATRQSACRRKLGADLRLV